MAEMTLFRFNTMPLSVTLVAGDPWFIAADVCRILDLANVSMALRILDEDEKGISTVDTLGGGQRSLIISEPGLYKLLSRSRRRASATRGLSQRTSAACLIWRMSPWRFASWIQTKGIPSTLLRVSPASPVDGRHPRWG